MSEPSKSAGGDWRRNPLLLGVWYIILPLLAIGFWFTPGPGWKLLVGAAALALAVTKGYVSLTDEAQRQAIPLDLDLPQPYGARLQGIHLDVQKLLADEGIRQMLRLTFPGLVSPATTRTRVKERLRLEGFTLRRTVTMDLRRPPFQVRVPRQIIVPIMRPEKGRLIDGLRIYGRTGGELRSLNTEESVIFNAAVLHVVFCDLFGLESDDPKKWSDETSRAYSNSLYHLVSVPRKLDGYTRDGHRERVATTTRMDLSEIPEHDFASAKDIDIFVNLVSLMATNYCIYAVVPHDEYGLITYEQSTKLAPSAGPQRGGRKARWRVTASHWVNSLLGTIPREFEIPAHKAAKCQSYHMELSISESAYIDTLCLADASGRPVMVAKQDVNSGYPYFRRSQVGTNQAHFYARNMSSVTQPLMMRVRVSERPGESLLRATLLSFLILGLSLWLSYSRRDLLNGPLDRIGTLTLMAGALPAIAAALWTVLGRKFHGRVIAKLSVLSAALSGVCLLSALQLRLDGRAIGYLMSHLVPVPLATQWMSSQGHAWRLLIAVCTAHAFLITVALVIRTCRVHNLARDRTVTWETAEARA